MSPTSVLRQFILQNLYAYYWNLSNDFLYAPYWLKRLEAERKKSTNR